VKALRVLAAAIIGFLAAAAPALAQAPPTLAADIVDFQYNPKDVTVAVNTAVTFTNHGARPHTVTDRGGTFDTNPIAPGSKGSITFSVPGRYYFFCRINPSKMNGSIVVTSGAASAPVNRVQATDPAREGDVLRFDPSSLTVSTGSTIVFANVGGKPHTLTADDGSFDSGVVTPGAEGGRFAGSNASITLNKAGTFPFHCEVHPQAMKGTLTVVGPDKQGPAAASAAPQAATVDVVDFGFRPSEISVAPGGQVTWRNTGQAKHTATFDDVGLDTGDMAPGTERQLAAPSKPGSYSYRCSIHPAKMRGVLVVVGQNVADPSKASVDKPAAAAGSAGPGGAISSLALGTGVGGAFFGGLGVALLFRRKPSRQAAKPSTPSQSESSTE
jgi:plastocyanin